MVQWLRLLALTAEGLELIPCQGTKVPQATWHSQTSKQTKNLPFRGADSKEINS